MNRAAYLKPEDPKVEEIAEAIGFFKEGPLKLNLGRCGFSLWVGERLLCVVVGVFWDPRVESRIRGRRFRRVLMKGLLSEDFMHDHMNMSSQVPLVLKGLVGVISQC